MLMVIRRFEKLALLKMADDKFKDDVRNATSFLNGVVQPVITLITL